MQEPDGPREEEAELGAVEVVISDAEVYPQEEAPSQDIIEESPRKKSKSKKKSKEKFEGKKPVDEED